MNRGFIRLASLMLWAGFSSALWGQENQIINGEFDDGLTSWGRYGATGYTVSVVSGARLSGPNAALMDVTDASVTSIGIAQGGLKFEKGKTYPVGVTAKADKEREMVILIQLYKPEVPTWIDIVMQRVALTTEPQTFLFQYTHNDDSMSAHPAWQATIYLMLKGQWWAMKNDTIPSKVWVDRVHVGEQPPLMDTTMRFATEPQPADGATDVPRDTILSWRSGEFIATHDVYFGTSFADVNAASQADPRDVLASKDQTDASYRPEGVLDYGQTYFWRVDEANGAPDFTVFKGKVWSFTVEPFSYPIVPIVATASSSQPGFGPENTINGSGLNAANQHSTSMPDMWMSGTTKPHWIQYEFDKVYKFDQFWVWNANQVVEAFVGFGAKDVVIEHSTDGEKWTVLEGVPEFTRAPGVATYTADTIVDFGGIMAKYVRVTINSNWGGVTQQTSLSEVRFFYIPLQAFGPQPPDGATNVSVGVSLSWRPGREATSHTVSIGPDAQDPGRGETATVTDHSYTPANLSLGTKYFWKVDESSDGHAGGQPGNYPGDVWSFTTEEFVVVEDFDRYNDDIDAETTIWHAWIDGLTDKASGSQVGYNEAPFAERTVVRSGSQSMPLTYDNTSFAFSEAKRTFDDAQDWTAHGVKTLAIHFAGTAGNTGKLYVKINNAKVSYNGDEKDLARTGWQAWNIDLTKITGMSNVRSLTIGVEGAGATGKLYFDDIRLSPKAPQYTTPAEPDNANLIAWYAFEGDVKDSSGKGRNGVAVGGPTYAAGVDGQALRLDGTDDYVTVGSVGISGAAPRTISGWVKADNTTFTDWTNLFGFTSKPDGVAAQSFDMNKIGGTNQYGIHAYGWERTILTIDLEWHHLAATYDGATIAWYGDGQFVASEAWVLNTQDNFQMGKRAHAAGGNFPGLIDEVRIYNKALSAEEIAWLAGRRLPIHKPL